MKPLSSSDGESLIILHDGWSQSKIWDPCLEFQLHLLEPSPSGKWGAKEPIWKIHLWPDTCPGRKQKPYSDTFKVTNSLLEFLSRTWTVFITFALEHLITKCIRNCSFIKDPISISLDIWVFDSNTYEKPH